MYILIRSEEVNDVELVKELVPRILRECSGYLQSVVPSDLDYKKIKDIFYEQNGDLDDFYSPYQVDARTMPHGKMFISYHDSCRDGNSFDVTVNSQVTDTDETRDMVYGITGIVKSILHSRQIHYREIINQ